jgi:hypothetical protein
MFKLKLANNINMVIKKLMTYSFLHAVQWNKYL